jgi:hypothetical protein
MLPKRRHREKDGTMASQLDLFEDQPRYSDPPHCGVETSRQAAESVANVSGKRAAVYRFIRGRGDRGATREEIEIGLGMRGNTVRPRVKELESVGLVRVTAVTRNTTSGRKANVIVSVNGVIGG